MPQWVEQGFQQYAQRMPAVCSLELLEIAAQKTWLKMRIQPEYYV